MRCYREWVDVCMGASCAYVWGDRKEVNTEGNLYKCPVISPSHLVSIPDENTKEKCTVYGRFPLRGPWWHVKVQVVRPARSKSYQVQGFPSYFLQADMSPPGQKQICSLFLKECGLASERIQEFLKWVDGVSGFENLHFGNLQETLRSFYGELEKKDKKPSTQNGQNAELKLEKSCK